MNITRTRIMLMIANGLVGGAIALGVWNLSTTRSGSAESWVAIATLMFSFAALVYVNRPARPGRRSPHAGIDVAPDDGRDRPVYAAFGVAGRQDHVYDGRLPTSGRDIPDPDTGTVYTEVWCGECDQRRVFRNDRAAASRWGVEHAESHREDA